MTYPAGEAAAGGTSRPHLTRSYLHEWRLYKLGPRLSFAARSTQ
jgi:hypothetical protein